MEPADGERGEAGPRRRNRATVVANLLSLSRIGLAALVWVAPHRGWWVLAILAIAGLTDVLDGWVVRRTRARLGAEGKPDAYAANESPGAFIDGLVDKILVLSVTIALYASVRPPLWAMGCLVARELLFVPVAIVYRLAPEHLRERVDFTSGKIGKAATVAQFAALVLGFLRSDGFEAAAVVAGMLGGLAVIYYVTRAIAGRRRPPDQQ